MNPGGIGEETEELVKNRKNWSEFEKKKAIKWVRRQKRGEISHDSWAIFEKRCKKSAFLQVHFRNTKFIHTMNLLEVNSSSSLKNLIQPWYAVEIIPNSIKYRCIISYSYCSCQHSRKKIFFRILPRTWISLPFEDSNKKSNRKLFRFQIWVKSVSVLSWLLNFPC